jgi:hypothetical protein
VTQNLLDNYILEDKVSKMLSLLDNSDLQCNLYNQKQQIYRNQLVLYIFQLGKGILLDLLCLMGSNAQVHISF